jgi:hypothetical protein
VRLAERIDDRGLDRWINFALATTAAHSRVVGSSGVSAETVCTENPHPGVKLRWNRLNWRDDRAALFRSGRPGLAIQVEVTA